MIWEGSHPKGGAVQPQSNPMLIDSLLIPESRLPVTYYLTRIHKTYKLGHAELWFFRLVCCRSTSAISL